MITEVASIAGGVALSAGQSVASEALADKAKGIWDDKFRFPRLIEKIKSTIKEKYEQYPFYNNLDAYLSENNTINKHIVSLAENINILSAEQFTNTNLVAFREKHGHYSSADYSLIEEAFEYIYDTIDKSLLELSIHTAEGKLQRTMQMEGKQTRESIEKVGDKLSEKFDTWMAFWTSQNASFAPTATKTLTVIDETCASAAVKDYLAKIEAIATQNNSDSNALEKYKELLEDVHFSLREETAEQKDIVLCSVECHMAIAYSNLGNVEKALECLSKIPADVADNSKLYHFVNAVIIINHYLAEKFNEASENIERALSLDKNYHRAFLLGEFLTAIQKKDTLENILTAVDLRFLPFVDNQKDKSLLSDYYIYRGFICKEFKEYELAREDFYKAKDNGYDPLVADYNIGLLYYSQATDHLPRDQRIFCADVDVELLRKVIDIFDKWMFNDDNSKIPQYIKARMVSIYASSCGILGVKHNLTPINEYVLLPGLEYEALRTIILGIDGEIDESLFEYLSPEDQLFAKMANSLKTNDYCVMQNLLSTINDEQIVLLSDPTIYLVVQASVANDDLETYKKYRSHIKASDSIGLLECVDAYAIEKSGDVESAKSILDKHVNSSNEYGILRNIVNFYIRNQFNEEAEQLLLKILKHYQEKTIFIDDKLDFFKSAILYLVDRKSNNASLFVEAIDENSSQAWRLKATYYDAVQDVIRLYEACEWLCENDFEIRFGFNKSLCLLKLMRYEDALANAKALLEAIPKNDISNQREAIWLISNTYLLMDNDEESHYWAKQAHELTIGMPEDKSHQAYFARAMRTGKSDESFGTIIPYTRKHPVVTSNWLKEVHFSQDTPGEDLVSQLSKITGYSNSDFEKNEQEIRSIYKNNFWCPTSLIFKHCNDEYSRLFEFAKNCKLRISNGDRSVRQYQIKNFNGHIFVDSMTLIVLAHYGCLDAIKNAQNIHVCYATLCDLQEKYQIWTSAGYVKNLLQWLQSSSNVILESDGYSFDSTMTDMFSQEYLIACRVATAHQIPLLTIEPNIVEIAKVKRDTQFNDLKIIDPVAYCFAVYDNDVANQSKSLYCLLEHCTFVSFTAQTIFHKIQENGYVVDDGLLSRFFICNSSCDMLSFAHVYTTTIRMLLSEHFDESIKFTSLVLDNATSIWHRNFSDRHFGKKYSDDEAISKTGAVIGYLIYLMSYIKQTFTDSLPAELQEKCRKIEIEMVKEMGDDFLRKIKRSIQLLDTH